VNNKERGHALDFPLVRTSRVVMRSSCVAGICFRMWTLLLGSVTRGEQTDGFGFFLGTNLKSALFSLGCYYAGVPLVCES